MYSYFRLYEHGAIFKSFFCLFIFQLGLSLKNDQWSRTGERHAGFVIKQLFLQAIICHLFNFFKNQFWWHVLVSFNYNNQTLVSKLWDGCFNDQKSVFIFYFFIKKKKKLHRIFGIVVSFKFNIIKTQDHSLYMHYSFTNGMKNFIFHVFFFKDSCKHFYQAIYLFNISII